MTSMPRHKVIAIFFAFAFAYFLSALIRAITATIAPTLVAEFQLQSADLGLLAGGYFLGFAAMQLPLGKWLDSHGPRKVETLFLGVALAGCLAFSQADGFTGLLFARILCGVGVCACLMAALTGYRRWFAPEQLMRANSWMLMVGAFGMVASTLPVQWLLPAIGWRGIFLALAGLMLISMLLITWQIPAWSPPSPVAGGPSPASGYGEVWRSTYFRSLAPLGFVNYGGLVAMQTLWAGPWMTKVAGYTPAQAASGLFWLNVAMLLAYWLWGLANPWLARKGHTAEKLIRWWMPLSFVMLAILIIAGSAISIWAAVIFALYCVSSTVAALAQPAVGMAFPAALAGRALSAYNLVIFAGVFAVQWGIGLLLDVLKSLGLTEVLAYQATFGVFGVASVVAYLVACRAKTP
ncbi:MFS transporter [Rhodoferax sp.]|uniref:MFS transporter n=1 Tax=Rhodoferax sp. TaxID=50421 RepID=UPI0025D2B0E1|nr:MFS transporter [Rhodoferax sp.]